MKCGPTGGKAQATHRPAPHTRMRYPVQVRKLSPVAVVAVLVASCAPSEAEIKSQFDAVLQRSNHCQSPDQCVLIDLACPLGCRAAVQADRASAVRKQARELIEDYERGGAMCVYDCTAPGTPGCEQGRCVEIPAVDAPGPIACTEIGCGVAFSVQFEKSGTWTPGHYRVDVSLDGRTVECAADFPLACDAALACDDPGISLQLSGCALPPESHAITGVDILTDTPAEVSVEVLDETGSLASGTWQPIYVTSQPNGPECSPECRTAPPVTLVIP
jgi:hypothetical protein